MDDLPFVTPVYKRDLVIENYFIGYLKHPYISIYTGRGCKSRCTFCLWPQTVGGHRYRTRSVGHVIEEIAWAQKAFPQVKEFFFDDDTFTDDLPRAEAIAARARQAGRHLVVQRQGQRAARDAEGAEGRRPAPAAGRLRIRQPADPAQHQEGHARRGRRALHQGLPRAGHRHPRHLHRRPAGRDHARRSSRPSSGRPGSTRTPSRCRWPRPIPAPSSTSRRWRTAGSTPTTPSWWTTAASRSRRCTIRTSATQEIFDSVETFYKRFYFRPRQDRRDRRRDGPQPRHDEAAPARGRGVLRVPEAPQARSLGRLSNDGSSTSSCAPARTRTRPRRRRRPGRGR